MTLKELLQNSEGRFDVAQLGAATKTNKPHHGHIQTVPAVFPYPAAQELGSRMWAHS